MGFAFGMRASDRREPRFLSPSTSSVSIAVSGVAQPVVADVSATSKICTTSGTTRTCTIPVNAPAGSVTFTATLYDGPNATGKVLGTGSVTQTIVAGSPFNVTLPVSGVPGAITVSTSVTAFAAGSAATTPVAVTVADPDGNVISGTYANPITLTDSDTTGSLKLSATTVTSSTQSVTLNYNGSATVSKAFISATATGVPAGDAHGVLVRVTGSALSGIYVTNYSANSLAVFRIGSSGNVAPVRVLAGAATGLSGPESIGLDGAGRLYTNNHISGGITVYPANANGNVAPVRRLTNAGLPSPNGVAIGAGDDVYSPNCPTCSGSGSGTNEVVHFAAGATASDRQFTSAPPAMTAPDSISVDESGNVYLNNGFTAGPVYVFPVTASGTVTPIRSIGLNAPVTNVQFVYYAANSVFVSDQSGVYLFPAVASGSTAASATFSSSSLGISYPEGMALDTTTANPTLYIADLFGNAIFVIKTSGTPPNLKFVSKTVISGALTGLNEPSGIYVVP